MLTIRKKGALTEAAMPADCQVRSRTESPCPNLAVVEIRGVAFCGPCAREQEAYFAIGELVARGEVRGPRSAPLTQAVERVRRDRAAVREGVGAEMHRGPSQNVALREL